MGIHNEPGTEKLPLNSVKEMVDTMLSKIVDTDDEDRSFVPFKNDGSDEVVLLVNDLGAISELEMGGITREGKHPLRTTRVELIERFSRRSCTLAERQEDQSS